MLLLPRAERARIEQWARLGYPNEACGLLVGRALGARVEIVRAELARNLNVERAHDRFDLDPADFMAIDERARADGLEIVGVWHTHPDHPAHPSETDRVAAWPEWSYVIAETTSSGVAALTSWRLNGEAFQRERIEDT